MAETGPRLITTLEARLNRFEKDFAKAQGIATKSWTAIEARGQRAAKRLETSLASSTANINRSLATIGVGLGLNELKRVADAYTTANNKIRASATASGVQARSLEALTKGANAARVSIEDYADLYARLIRSGADVAKTEQQIADVTNIVAKAFKAGGASAQEQASGITQLGQALGSGVLAGDELKALRENAPLLAKAIADAFGVTIGQLKKLGAEGKLTSEKVFAAILAAGPTIEKQFAATTSTIQDGIVRIQNAFTLYLGSLTQTLQANQSLGDALRYIADNFATLANGAAAAAAIILSRYVPALARVALAQAAVVLTNPFGLIALAVTGAVAAFTQFNDTVLPIGKNLATVGDYGAAAWESLQSGASQTADAITAAFSTFTTVVEAAFGLGGATAEFQKSSRSLSDIAIDTADAILNAFRFVGASVATIFENIGPVAGEALYNALQTILAGLQAAINTAIASVNVLIEGLNYLGANIPKLSNVNLGGIENPFAGAGEKAGKAFAENFKIFGESPIRAALADLQKRAEQIGATRRAQGDLDRIVEEQRRNNALPKGRETKVAPEDTKRNAFDRETAKLRENIELLKAETQARLQATGTEAEQEAQIERTRKALELLNAAKEAGLTIDQKLIDQVNTLTAAWQEASIAAKQVAEAQRQSAENAKFFEDAERDAFKGFINDLAQGKSATDALRNALAQLGQKLLNKGLDQLFDQLFKGTGGFLNVFGGPQSGSVGQASISAGVVSVNGAPVGGLTAATPTAPTTPTTTTAPTPSTSAAPSAPSVKSISQPEFPQSLIPRAPESAASTYTPQFKGKVESLQAEAAKVEKAQAEVAKTLQKPIPSELGSVSAKYESGGRGVGFVSSGYKDPGGPSYGVHQLSSKDSIRSFLRSPEGAPYAARFQGLTPGSRDFNAVYKDIARKDPTAFAAAQKNFYTRTHYNPARDFAAQKGFDVNDRGVQEAIFSASIQHGGVNKITANAARRLGPNASPEEQIRALYGARSDYVSRLDLPGETKRAILNGRYPNEQRDALRLAGQRAPDNSALAQQSQIQQQLAQQTAAANAQLTQVPQAFDGIQTGAQGLKGNLANLTQGISQGVPATGSFDAALSQVTGQLAAGTPAASSFSGALQSVLQTLAQAPGGGGGFGGIASILGGFFADGGMISGPGTSRSDSILAAVSNGEYVVNAKATKKNLPLLDAINSGKVPKFADGGPVGGFMNNSYSARSSQSVNNRININVAPNQRDVASEIARKVSEATKPPQDTFRKSDINRAQEFFSRGQLAQRRNG